MVTSDRFQECKTWNLRNTFILPLSLSIYVVELIWNEMGIVFTMSRQVCISRLSRGSLSTDSILSISTAFAPPLILFTFLISPPCLKCRASLSQHSCFPYLKISHSFLKKPSYPQFLGSSFLMATSVVNSRLWSVWQRGFWPEQMADMWRQICIVSCLGAQWAWSGW